VNPEHLFLGTPGDNSRDMMKKGRSVNQKDSRGRWLPLEKIAEESTALINGGISNE